jgi:hypothetical protein
MKKEELKSLIKPLVKECIEESIREILLSSGVLSSVVQEVLKGTLPVLSEQVQQTLQPQKIAESNINQKFRQNVGLTSTILEQARKEKANTINELQKNRKSLKIGNVDIFENVSVSIPQDSSESNVADPLAGLAANDPGIDISQIPGIKRRYSVE